MPELLQSDRHYLHPEHTEKEEMKMANLMKFTAEDVATICGHNGRTHEQYSNPDIDKSKTHLNYSFTMTHKGKDFDHYKKIIGENYLYGRGSKREAGAVTAASWVVSAPEEIIGDLHKEHDFFEAVFCFVSERYGPDNIINNAVHYDEKGAPHIHIMFVPVTDIDHDQIHFKTIRTKQAVVKESGRIEFGFRYKLDENGERIPLKNYAKMSDYYDRKISANDVLNKLELQQFHKNLQSYLDEHGNEGKVITGATGGTSYSVKDLKEFSQATGMNLKDIKELDRSKPILQSFVEQQQKNVILEQTVKEKDTAISRLQTKVLNQETEIKKVTAERDTSIRHDRTSELSEKLSEKETEIRQRDETIGKLQKNLSAEREKTRTLEAEKTAAVSNDRTAELTEKLSESDRKLANSETRNTELEQSVSSLNETINIKDQELDAKQKELDAALEKIKTLEAEKAKEVKEEATVKPAEKDETWGRDSSWGSDSGWGSKDNNKTKNNEIIW